MRRTDQRRAAVWALYQSDLLGRPPEELHQPDTLPFTRALTRLVRERVLKPRSVAYLSVRLRLRANEVTS